MMTSDRHRERIVAHCIFAAFLVLALVTPPEGGGRLSLAALGAGVWWYASRGRASRVLAIAIFLAGWFGGAWPGWIALIVAVVVRRTLFGKAPSAEIPAAQPMQGVAGPPAEESPRTPNEVLAAWPANARDVLAAAEQQHDSGYIDEILKDPRRYVRHYAIRELGRRRDARAVNALVVTLWDEDFLTRLYSARALARIGNEEARSRLFEAFERAWTAQTRLDRRDEPITSEERDRWEREAKPLREISESLVIVGPAAIDPLLAALRDGSDSAIEWTIVPLGALGAASAVPLMLDRISDKSPFIRTQARAAIFRIGGRALPLLMEREQHGSELARGLVRHLVRVFHDRPPEWAEGPPDLASAP